MPEIKRTDRKKWEGAPNSGTRARANHKFYVSPPYRKSRREYKKREPYCEVCKHRGWVEPMKILEHIVPINSGGAKLDFRNFMSVCKLHADMKNGLEAQAGGSIVAYRGVYGDFLPEDRGQVIDLLLRAEKRPSYFSPDVPQP